MASIFTKIINGEIPSYKVFEDDHFFAFLDINPLRPGHTLVVPKKEVDYIFDIEDDLLGDMMIFAKKIAKGLKVAANGKRIGVSVIGLEVPHAHVHLIPIDSMNDLNFGSQHSVLSSDEMVDWAKRIGEAIE